MASRTKIYIVLEYVTGGELFNKIVSSSLYVLKWQKVTAPISTGVAIWKVQ